MNDRQLSFYSEAETARMISPAFSKKKNQAEWELRKERLGAISADLSNTLLPQFGIRKLPKKLVI